MVYFHFYESFGVQITSAVSVLLEASWLRTLVLFKQASWSGLQWSCHVADKKGGDWLGSSAWTPLLRISPFLAFPEVCHAEQPFP